MQLNEALVKLFGNQVSRVSIYPSPEKPSTLIIQAEQHFPTKHGESKMMHYAEGVTGEALLDGVLSSVEHCSELSANKLKVV